MRKQIFYACILLLTTVCSAHAQLTRADSLQKLLRTENKDTVAWLHGGTINIGINQGFLHNWAAGGELASLTMNGMFNGFITRLYHRSVWTNNLDMNYSLFYNYSNNFVPRKIDDRIDFSSRYGYRVDTAKDFYLTMLFNFKSQFTKGYDYNLPNFDTMPTSEFLAPAYFILASGMEYRKGSNLQIFFSPVAARYILVDREFTLLRPEGAFGVAYGERSRFELGAFFSGRYLVDITRHFSYKARVDMYSNYLAKDKTDSLGVVVKKDNPGNIDILWDNLFLYKFSRFVSLSLGATFIYDNDQPYIKTYVDESGVEQLKNEPGTGLGWAQLRQLFTVGLVYKF